MSTAIQKNSPKGKTDTFMQQVEQRRETFGRLLPRGVDPAWFTAEVRVALARTPKLMECDSVSVFDALTTCAQLGLSPSGRLGSAYLIPFRDKCQLVVGYKGLIDLAYRSGEIIDINVEVVYENDGFIARHGFDLTVEHERTEDEPGALRAVYACARTKAGGVLKELMYRRDVLPIKTAALSKKRQGAPPTPWETNEPEMWKKTVLRRLLKRAPLSPQKAQLLGKAFEAEDAEWEDMPTDVEVEAPAAGMAGLKNRLKAKTEGPELNAIGTEASREMAGLPVSHPDAQPPEPGTEG